MNEPETIHSTHNALSLNYVTVFKGIFFCLKWLLRNKEKMRNKEKKKVTYLYVIEA